MTNVGQEHTPGDSESDVGRQRSTAGLSDLFGATSQALVWWHQRQVERRELKQLCAREFAEYHRATRLREL